jgi:hypothetical protein
MFRDWDVSVTTVLPPNDWIGLQRILAWVLEKPAMFWVGAGSFVLFIVCIAAEAHSAELELEISRIRKASKTEGDNQKRDETEEHVRLRRLEEDLSEYVKTFPQLGKE